MNEHLSIALMQQVALGAISPETYRSIVDPLERAIRDISVPHDELIALAEAKAQAASDPF